MQISDAAKYVADTLKRSGFSAHVLVDREGNPVAATGWYKELVVSKINLETMKVETKGKQTLCG